MKQALFGEHGFEVWIGAFIWTLIGIVLVKTYFYNSANKFNLKFWLNDNLKDTLLGLLSSLVILRLGDGTLHILEDKFDYSVPFDTNDFVGFLLVVSIFIQYKLHKARKPISNFIKTQMHMHNEHCKDDCKK